MLYYKENNIYILVERKKIFFDIKTLSKMFNIPYYIIEVALFKSNYILKNNKKFYSIDSILKLQNTFKKEELNTLNSIRKNVLKIKDKTSKDLKIKQQNSKKIRKTKSSIFVNKIKGLKNENKVRRILRNFL